MGKSQTWAGSFGSLWNRVTMSTGVKVTSIEALVSFRESLCTFSEDVREALSAAEADIHRTFDWLEEELKWWQKEIYRRQDLVGQAKVALNRKKMERIFGRKPDITEEEKQLRKAMRRLEEGEDMVKRIKKAVPQLQHAVTTYQGPARQLAGFIDGVVPNDLVLLERMITALDAYVRLAPPSRRPSSPSPEGVAEPGGVKLAVEQLEGPTEESNREPANQSGPDSRLPEKDAAVLGGDQPPVG